LSRTLVSLLVSLRLVTSGPDLSSLEATFDRIVGAARAQVGVGLIHVESGARLSIHGDEPFAMASVYKLPIALELLMQVNEGTLTLDWQVPIGPGDIRPCCTLSRRHPNGGIRLTAGELLELMIVESDNTAADAVLKLVGGPPVVERRLRALGFNAINVNRYEGDINFEMTGVLHPVAPPSERRGHADRGRAAGADDRRQRQHGRRCRVEAAGRPGRRRGPAARARLRRDQREPLRGRHQLRHDRGRAAAASGAMDARIAAAPDL
jgi:beta-lactamase class A